MKTRARHTIVTYRRSNISTQFSRGHSLRTNLAPRQSRSIINATLEGVGDYPSLGHAVFALLEFPSRFDLSLSFSPPPTPPFRSKDLSAARNNKVPEWKATDTVSNVVYINRLAFLLQRSKRKFSSYDSRYRIKFWKRENRSRLLSLCKIYVFTYRLQHYRGRDKSSVICFPIPPRRIWFSSSGHLSSVIRTLSPILSVLAPRGKDRKLLLTGKN